MVVPRPLRDGGLFAVLLGLVAVAWSAGVASWIVSAVLVGALTVIAVQRGIHDRGELARCRRLADRLIAAHPGSDLLLHEVSPLAAWRAAELTSERHRRSLARALRERIEEPVPGSRQAVFMLRRLEERLADVSRPVGVRGVLLVTGLLEDGTDSPLNCPRHRADLFEALGEALVFLEEPSTR